MSFAAALAWSLLRAVFVAAVAVPVSAWQESAMRQRSGGPRRWFLVLMFAPLFAPDLLVGYAYARFDLSLLHRPLWNEAFYLVLLTLKFAPAGLVLRLIAPPPLHSAAADHCRRLLSSAGDSRRSRFARRPLASRPVGVAVATLVFLLAFQEFEIASEMSVAAWAVHLFDSQADGLNLETLLRRTSVPAGIQIVLTGLLVWWLADWTRLEVPRWNEHDASAAASGTNGAALLMAVAAAVLLLVLPLSIVGVSGLNAARSIVDNPSLVRSFVPELAVAIILAATAGIGAATVSAWLAHRLRASSARTVIAPTSNNVASEPVALRDRSCWLIAFATVVLVVIGSLGSLVLSAFVLAAIQLPGLVIVRDTVLPLVTTLILFLLPRGLFLFLIVAPALIRESDYLAGLLTRDAGSRRQAFGASHLWASGPRRSLLLSGLLGWWAFLNLTATAMLCPASISLPGTTGAIVPLPVRLYNLMHYGRNGPLSLMTLLSVLVPLAVFVLVERLLALLWRRRFQSSFSVSNY
ncbi:hypothetical protein GC176_03760 [bacterium]|nr:hypothetical protein [bacterium]